MSIFGLLVMYVIYLFHIQSDINAWCTQCGSLLSIMAMCTLYIIHMYTMLKAGINTCTVQRCIELWFS